jgi:hypothetical protein
MKPQDKKEYTLYRLKEAYTSSQAKHIKQAYKDLKTKYNQTPLKKWDSVPESVIGDFDHLRSLLIRCEQIERAHDLKRVKESERLCIKLERHKYAPELNKAHYIKVINKAHQLLQTIPAPQCTTIDEALNNLTGIQLKNLLLYV